MSGAASVQTLIGFLRDEVAAAESYRRALPRFEDAPDGEELRACLASHERRITTLEQRIRDLGGDPRGGGSSVIELPLIGDDAISALEAREDHGLKHYLDDVCKLDRDPRRMVAREILPEQVRTYDSLSDLKLTRRL